MLEIHDIKEQCYKRAEARNGEYFPEEKKRRIREKEQLSSDWTGKTEANHDVELKGVQQHGERNRDAEERA